MLRGRVDALERLAWVVAGAGSGAGGAVLLTGEPGSGKSTLVEQALSGAGDALLLRTTGVPVESGLPHAGLHALLRPLATAVDVLAPLQRAALAVALGLEGGPAPSPFLVGAATLTLLSHHGERRPVLLVVDDAQWVDDASLQALAFAARRLTGERVGFLAAARTGAVPESLAGLERVDLAPLDGADAAALLGPAGVALEVADRMVGLVGGNPLALVELGRTLTPDQRSGLSPLPVVGPAADVFGGRVADLPVDVRDAVALAALADGLPAGALDAARSALGLPAELLAPAEVAGLLLSGPEGVQWRHPLARAAALAGVAPRRRRDLASGLAAVAAGRGAPEAIVLELRLAAADGPDEVLALGLERVAEDAERAGDQRAAARAWQRASAVGTDAARNGHRLLGSAGALLRSGQLDLARAGYDGALAGGLRDDQRATAHLARGRAEHLAASPRRAVAEFRAAADAAGGEVRVRACAEGVLAAMYAAAGPDALALAEAADAAHDPDRPAERLLARHAAGAAACLAGDLERGRPLLAEVLAVAAGTDVLATEPELALWVVTAPLFAGRGSDPVDRSATDAIEQLRLRGDLLWLPRVVRLRGVRQWLAGSWLAAHASFDEAVDLARLSGQTTQLVESLSALAELEAVRGERERCLAHVDEVDRLLAGLDVPFLAARGWQVRGLLHLGLGEPHEAAAVLAPALAAQDGANGRDEALADLVEALLLADRRDEAVRAAASTSGPASHPRSAGLLAEDDAAAAALLAAAAGATDDPFEAARCRLLAGERHRRAGLRREARDHLRAAADAFAAAGAVPWRRRAEEGLRASGESLRRADEAEELLTGAELRVATLVAEGRPTREVAALLFLSPKTVEFHLGRVYRKLGLRGRAELAARMAGSGR